MGTSTPSDSELLAIWLTRRSEPAFRALVTRYAALVHMAARRTCGDDALAADASQLVFILLAQKAKSLVSRTSLAGWLHITAVMCAKRLIAKTRRETRKLQHLHTAMEPQTHSSSESPWLEIQPILDEALSTLSVKDRETLLLKFYRSLSVREIATTLGIGADAAQKRLDRATERLRQKLARRGVHTAGTTLAATLVAGFANDAHAASSSISTLTAQAVVASTTHPSLTTFIKLIFMTHKALLTTTVAVILVGILVTTALISGGGKNVAFFSSLVPSPHSIDGVAIVVSDSSELSTEVRKISRPRPTVSPKIAALNERFGAGRVKLALQCTEDIKVTLTTALKMIDHHLEIFDPKNENVDQMAKTLFGEFSDILNLSHGQSNSIKIMYSALLGNKRYRLHAAISGITDNSISLTERLLYADIKTAGVMNGMGIVQTQNTAGDHNSPFVTLHTCAEDYEPSIHRSPWLRSVLKSSLNPEQAETYRKKLESGLLDSKELSQPADLSFLNDQFLNQTPLKEITKKMEATRQEMDSLMNNLNKAGK